MRRVPNMFVQLQSNIKQIIAEEVANAQAAIGRRIGEIFGFDGPVEEVGRTQTRRGRPRGRPPIAKAARAANAQVKETPLPAGRLSKLAQEKGRKVILQFAKDNGKVGTTDLRKLNFFKKLSDNQIRNLVMPMVDEGMLQRKGERSRTQYLFVGRSKGQKSKAGNTVTAPI